MKRLRELDPDSPLLEQAQRLLASTDALPDSQERLLRVRRRLDRPRRGGLLAFARRLPALAVAGLLLMFGASAFAALRLFEVVTSRPVLGASPVTAAGKGEHAGQSATPQRQAVVASAPTSAGNEVVAEGKQDERPAPALAVNEARRGERREHKPGQAHAAKLQRTRVPHFAHGAVPLQPIAADAPVTSGSALHPQPLEAPESTDLPRAARPQPSRADGRTVQSVATTSAARQQPLAASAHAVQSVAATRSTEPTAVVREEPNNQPADAEPLADSELVHRALKALRHDHDPALAARLLDQRRAADRNGPLAEEALALQVEASTQLKQARSRELARSYLARYPSGRYRDVAQRALQEPVP